MIEGVPVLNPESPPYEALIQGLDSAVQRLQDKGGILPENIIKKIDFLKGMVADPDRRWWAAFLTVYSAIWATEIFDTYFILGGLTFAGGSVMAEQHTHQSMQIRLTTLKFLKKICIEAQRQASPSTEQGVPVSDEFSMLFTRIQKGNATQLDFESFNRLACSTMDINHTDLCLQMGASMQEQVVNISKGMGTILAYAAQSVAKSAGQVSESLGDIVFDKLIGDMYEDYNEDDSGDE